MLDKLQKHLLYANFKKCQDEMRFLGYIVFYQDIQIEENQIKNICDWPKTESVRDIQVFLEFANFYQQFMQRFSKFDALLTFIPKTTLVEVKNENLEQSDNRIQMKD